MGIVCISLGGMLFIVELQTRIFENWKINWATSSHKSYHLTHQFEVPYWNKENIFNQANIWKLQTYLYLEFGR